ncbi:hypothetical protein GCM10023196_069030 [Actinoallomurus vinaceus]|uniref:histidine kinase n=1 Tax=Actinoallomurus vinaceus TaxID=1080074 RepID=A0ABP8ULS3_9ACTN
MASDPEDLPPRLARGMMWTALGLLFAIRLMSGRSEGVPWPNLLLTMAPYPALVAVLARRGPGPRVRYVLLAAVAASYAAPFLVLGADWAWLPWPVAVAVLCLLPARAAWPSFILVLAVTAVGGLLMDESLLITQSRVAATATDGLILFSLYALADMVSGLHAARDEQARLATLRERLRLDGELREVVGGDLRSIAERLERAARSVGHEPEAVRTGQPEPVRTGQPEAVLTDLREAVDAARGTLAGIRATASEYRTSGGPGVTPIESPRLARRVLLAVLLLQATKVLFELGFGAYGHPALMLLGVPLLYGMVALQMAQLRRPTRTRLVLIVLAVVPAALPGSYLDLGLGTVIGVWGLATGAVLAHVRPPRSWAIAALLLAGHLSVYFYPPPVPPHATIVTGVISHVILAWLVYSLTRLADLVVLLDRAKHDLTREAVARERVRIARDLHDVLGFSLSAVALRGELVIRLLERDPAQAGSELAALRALVGRARGELASIADGRIRLRLRREIDTALEVLAAAGVATDARVETERLPDSLDTALAAVLRESVTNVLRHSDARTCTISVACANGVVRLRVVNDGARPERGRGGGSGLAGLAERTGGRLTAVRGPGGTFEVVAEFRSDPAGLGGDADGVHTVAGAQLGDR